MRRIVVVGALSIACWPGASVAEEGMFPPDRLPLARMRRAGLKLAPAKLEPLFRAVAQVARGGSGSFVSRDGLLVTNHHVAYGCLVRLNNDPRHRGILGRGYLARRRADEIVCPGYDLLVVQRVENVTAKVLAKIPAGNARNYHRRHVRLRRRREALRRACEAGGGKICEVKAMDGGTAFYRTIYRRIRDVRLVYAPPESLGNFGGDVDNWMYPRHSADFSYLRAYVGADGSGRAYARSNVPLRTPNHLRVSRKGVSRGAMVMVIGFPGRTMRHANSHLASDFAGRRLRGNIALIEKALATLAKAAKRSRESRRRYARLEARLQNAVKYYRMARAGFSRWPVLRRRRALERRIVRRGGAVARRLLREIGRVQRRTVDVRRKLEQIYWLVRVVPSLRCAYDVVRWSWEKGRPDAKREDERYKDKNTYRFLEAADRLEREIELPTERSLLHALLAEHLARTRARPTARLAAASALRRRGVRLLAGLRRRARRSRRPLATIYARELGAPLTTDPLRVAIDDIYQRSKVAARDARGTRRARAWRRRLFSMKANTAARARDPLLRFAAALEREHRVLRRGPRRLLREYLGGVLHPRFVKLKRAVYPDANFTVRLSFGRVRDYVASKDRKRHRYITSVKGLLAKVTGRPPFRVPAAFRRAAARRRRSRFRDRIIGDIPVNFTATLDTTGGNSGSPVLDARGRLVGLLFDGTPESVLSDWQYLPREQRSICFDIRFAHYLAEVAGAKRLLRELGLRSR